MKTSKKYSRQLAIILLFSFVFQTVFPTTAYALTGGPSQPEVQSFEPVGTTQMVDAFSGDFNYNIPLLEIDGYPINLAYHSGVTTDQEASWVGLGWNINPGVINRNMRGVPDDFDGDLIEKETEMKPDATTSVNFGSTVEILGLLRGNKNAAKIIEKLKVKSFSLSTNWGININNYRGVGFDFGITPHLSFGDKLKSNFSFSLSNSSQDGASVTPRIGLSAQLSVTEGQSIGLSPSGGFSINSRQGLKDVNISPGISVLPIPIASANYSNNSFASKSYTPIIKHSMNSFNVSFDFKVGMEFKPLYINQSIFGSYSRQALGESGRSSKSNKSYGSYYLENAIDAGSEILLDFNREKEGSFSKENPTLAIPQNTFDLYSYSGQGIGGMFRTFRSDLPVFHDPENNSQSNNSNLGVDIGLGDLFKAGAAITFNRSESRSGIWKSKNFNNISVLNGLGFGSIKKDINSDPLFEPAYFKNIGEKTIASKDFLPYDNFEEVPQILIANPKFKNPPIRSNPRINTGHNFVATNIPIRKKRPNRDKRNVFVRNRKGSDSKYCVQQGIQNTTGFGYEGYATTNISRVGGERKGHHTTEISVINPDGNKYVYGIPAYNTEQIDYAFTYAKDIGSSGTGPSADCAKGEIEYNSAGITESGTRVNKGIDYYFDKTKTPAYAHSYLLTHILSNDYVDVGNDGPGTNDIGTYVKINYNRVHSAYRWRVPYGENRANFNEGLKSDRYDDNANFTFGKKEIWHVHSIEGRNHIAVFFISARKDGLGVLGVNGGRDETMQSYKLDSIKLFSLNDIVNPIKSVYFEYDYSLCPQVPNNVDFNPNSPSSVNTGKLTLKKVYFTYGNSLKGKFNSYKFDYNSFNPTYNLKAYDRWGNYKPETESVGSDVSANGVCDNRSILLSKDYSYVNQNKETADQYSQAWTLKKITLPSGGEIEVTYEADDYAYVQDRIATQMYRLLGASNNTSAYYDKLFDPGVNYNYLYFQVDESITDNNIFRDNVLKDLKDLYFNVLVDIDNKGSTEYVRGYAKPVDAGLSTVGGNTVGWIQIEEENIADIGNVKVNAISLASWNFANLYIPHLIYPGSNTIKSEMTNSGKIKEFAKTIIGFFPEMYNLIRGVNKKLMDNGFASKFIPEKSWIKANNATGYKFGGGCRVKKIVSIDKWKSMEGTNNVEDFEIGQEYNYEVLNGNDSEGNPIFISSGVASYEPMVGGDENVFKKPVYYDHKQTLIPDITMFAEEPFGESFFPSPSVGYSRVSVKTISSATQEELFRNGSGKVVYEFFTTKDYPTIVQTPQPEIDEHNPNLIFSLLFKNIEKSLTMTQGIQIILNDMNGKPKGTWNFDQKNIDAIDNSYAYEGVKYEYFETIEGGKRKLKNEVRVISPNNTIETALIGVESDVIADSRQFNTENFSGGINLNLDVFQIGLIPIPIPTGIPSFDRESTAFQSGVIVRVVNTYGILKTTTAYQEGASLKTENTLFDAETGEVIMSKTQNEFEDFIYNTNYPAHWAYDGMGASYKNDGLFINIIGSSSTDYSFKAKIGSTEYVPDVFFAAGDLLEVNFNGATIESEGIWVHKSDNNKWRLIDKNGSLIYLNPSETYTARIISTGRKNMASTGIASISSLKDHSANSSNELQYSNTIQDSILSVSVNEFGQKWHKDGCYGFGLKKDTVKLYQDAVDIFNHLLNEGVLSMANAEEYVYSTDSLEIYEYPYKKDDVVNAPGINSLFEKTTTYKIRERHSNPGPYDISAIQVRRQPSGGLYLPSKNFTFNYDFGYLNHTNSNEQIWTYIAMSFAFNAIDNTELLSLEGKTISHIEVDFNQTPTTDVFYNYGAGWLSPTFPAARYEGAGIIYFTDNTSKTGTVDIRSSYYRERTIYGLEQETINPYLTGVRGNWKPKKQWTYITNRAPQSGSSNIRRSGYFKDYQNFWASGTNGWEKQEELNNKWQFTKETTLYAKSGEEIESKNPLNIYNSKVLDEYSKLPIAVANNARQNQVFYQGFEVSNYYFNNSSDPKCPASHSMIDPLSSLIDTSNVHTGTKSYKVTTNTRLLKTYTYHASPSLTPIEEEFVTTHVDYRSPFMPTEGKYIISAWVKVGSSININDYSNAKLRVVKSTTNTISDEGTPSAGTYYDFTPTGPIIDGWQRVEGEFEINSDSKMMSIRLVPDPGNATYFDDIRVFPSDAIMKSYVYEPSQLKLWAELDENNYATFYEYDKGGNLIRVKKETERGIMTIKDTKSSLKKSN